MNSIRTAALSSAAIGFAALAGCAATMASARQPNTPISNPQSQSADPENLRARQLDLVNARYLAYFHYGMNAFVWGQKDKASGDWGTGQAPVSLWDPTGLDARQSAREVKAAGMTGAILTTKHHDGFALWDSQARVTWPVSGETVGQETGYDVGGAGKANPGNRFAGQDVVCAFVDAMRAENLKVGLYFSIMDFHMGITNGNVSADKKAFVKAQLTELLTRYGPLDYVNLDGYVNSPPQVSGEDVPFADTGGWYVLDVFPKGYDEPRAASDSIYSKWFYWPGSKLKEGHEDDFAKKLNLLNETNGTLVLNVPPGRDGRIPDEAIAYPASIANDGMIDGDNRLRRVAMTNPGAENWWQVDLEDRHRIDAITIYNRTDCCTNRLSNYRVELLDAQGRPIWSRLRKLPPNPATTVTVDGVQANKLRITLLDNEQLQLAEVIVTGK